MCEYPRPVFNKQRNLLASVCWTIAFGFLHVSDSCASLAQAPDAVVAIRSTVSGVFVSRQIKKAAESEGMGCYVDTSQLLCQFSNVAWNAIIVVDEGTWIGAEIHYTVDVEANSARAKDRKARLRRVMEKFAHDVRGHAAIKAVVWCRWPPQMNPERDMCVGENLLNP